MNFLALCNRLVEKCGISGTMASVDGQRGEPLRVVNWINDAWYEIQASQQHWRWMRYEFQFNTTAGKQEYTPTEVGATSFRLWHTDSFRMYNVSLGVVNDHPINEELWASFRNYYIFGVVRQEAPSVFAIKPRDNSIALGYTPNDVYHIYGEYQKAPRYLSGYTDTPDFPEEYHMAIVHKARMKYAAYENAPEVLSEAQRDFAAIEDTMVMQQIDSFHAGEPLA